MQRIMLAAFVLGAIVTPSPGPSATPASNGACPSEVRMLRTTVADPQYKPDRTVVVTVNVTVGSNGKPLEAHIVQSSMNLPMDQAALRAAVTAQYEPKTIPVPIRRQTGTLPSHATDGFVCQPVTGTYVFKVTFEP
jgi:TonB family protein